MLGIYAVLLATYVWRYRELLRRSSWPLFAFAVGILAISTLFDDGLGEVFVAEARRRLEDEFKLFGYAFLTVFFVRFAARMVTEANPLARADAVANEATRASAPAGPH